jgi:hypothetical protein
VNNDPVNYVDLWGLSASDGTITVVGIGSGVGVNFSVGAGPVEVTSMEWVNVSFSISETGQFFTASYVNMVKAREGIVASASLYYVSSESKKAFPAGTSPEAIASNYAGTAEYLSVPIGPFTISGAEQDGWSIYSVSVGPAIGFSSVTVEIVTTEYTEGSLDVRR